MQNPSGDSTSPSSSPDQPPPPPSDLTQPTAGDVIATAEGGSSVGGVTGSDTKIFPSQVVDLTTGHGGNGSPVGGAVGEGGSSAAAVTVGGGVVVEGGSSVALMADKQGKQKRKPFQLSDPPPWPPRCNECGKEFPSWKSAFGHMRAHPNRDYRGFFKPPTSSSSSSPIRQRVHQQGENINTGVEQGGGERGASSAPGGVGFDLNQPMKEEVRSSSAAAERNEAPECSSSTAGMSTEEEKKIGFDLNELPPPEDEDEHKP